MGRVKLPIKKILNNTNRQVTYSKRRNGILKKAYEIAVLCGIDIALIMISPSGRITFFSGKKRIEDVLLQYLNLNDEEIELDQEDSEEKLVNDREGVISTLMRLRTEATNANQSPKDLSTLMEENMGLQHQIDKVKEQLRAFEPDLQKFTSLKEMESCEEHLCKTLDLIEQRKKILLSNHSSSYQETVELEKLMMENEGAMTSMHNNGTYQFQPQSSESWKDKEFIYPENLMNQMLGEGKGKEVAITNGVPLPNSSSYGLSDAPLQVNINPDNLQQYIKNYGSDKVRMEAPVPQQQSENINSSFGNFSGLKSNNCYLGYPTSLSSSNLVDMTTFDLGLPKNQLMQGFDETNGMEKGKEINNGENGDALPLVHYSPSES